MDGEDKEEWNRIPIAGGHNPTHSIVPHPKRCCSNNCSVQIVARRLVRAVDARVDGFDQATFVRRYSGGQILSKTFEFLGFIKSTLKTYTESNRSIDRFALRTDKVSGRPRVFPHELLQLTHLAAAAAAAAVNMGATDLDLDLGLHPSSTVALPKEVLRSETLVRLSLVDCAIDSRVKWPQLKSLTLRDVRFGNADEAMSEEFTLSHPRNITLSRENPRELCKLMRLFLRRVASRARSSTNSNLDSLA